MGHFYHLSCGREFKTITTKLKRTAPVIDEEEYEGVIDVGGTDELAWLEELMKTGDQFFDEGI